MAQSVYNDVYDIFRYIRICYIRLYRAEFSYQSTNDRKGYTVQSFLISQLIIE